MPGAEFETIMGPRPPPSETTTEVVHRSKLSITRPSGPPPSQTQKVLRHKPRCIPKIKGGDQRTKGRGARSSEGAGDHFFDSKRPEIEKCVKGTTRAPGHAELDSNVRIGPDVIFNCVECTPLLLWSRKKVSIVDFAKLMEKESDEIVPISPRDSELLESELFQVRGDTPPMSWSANLTALEEEEFKAEGAFIDNVRIAHNLPLETEEEDRHTIQTVRVQQKDGNFISKERVRVILTESDTTFVLELPGKLIGTMDIEHYAKTEARNIRYQKLCETILVSGSYLERSSQTFLERERDKSTQATGQLVMDAENYCNTSLMLDEWNRVKEMETKKKLKDEEDAMIKAIAARAQEELYEEKQPSSSGSDNSDVDDDAKVRSTVDWVRLEEEEVEPEVEPPADISDSELEMESEDEFEIEMDLDELYRTREERATNTPPKKLPDIKFQISILDRLISTNRVQAKHVEARGFENPFKHFDSRSASSRGGLSLALTRATALVEGGVRLARFWSFVADITKGKEVTCIALHPTNGNLIAASYGSTDFASTVEGLVCVWNLKNVNYPERTFEFKSSVTAIAFSNLTPYLLAVGLLDGNVIIYDIRKSKPQSVGSTLKSSAKHFGPVWDAVWLQETEIASTGTMNEVLVTLADDGFLYRWNMSKGFDPSVMLKIRGSQIKIPGKRERRAEALISQFSSPYTICFYPDDYTQYLIGTEEGFIHKANTSYTEQTVGTYVGHTGPVYKIRFSPFVKDVFISCGGDWCVKIWKEDMLNALMTFRTGLRTIYDVAWAPTLPTVFICSSTAFAEVWDISADVLEPVIEHKPPAGVGLRKIIFWDYLRAVVIGDTDGALTVSSLRNFPPQPMNLEDQIDNLLAVILPGYERRHPKEEDDGAQEDDEDEEAQAANPDAENSSPRTSSLETKDTVTDGMTSDTEHSDFSKSTSERS